MSLNDKFFFLSLFILIFVPISCQYHIVSPIILRGTNFGKLLVIVISPLVERR